MGTFSSLGQEIWEWEPFVALSLAGRNLWLALYTSRLAKLYPPGLFVGGLALMAESARMSVTDTCEALAELEAHRLIERDSQRGVLAFTMLPDRHERPANGRCLKKWWNLFRGIPVCPVRDRWVTLLSWLVHPMTGDHASAWAQTFGSVMPLPIQPSVPGSAYPQAVVNPVDKPQMRLSFHDLGEDDSVSAYGISGSPDTVCDTVSDTHRGEGSGIRDQGSGRSGQQPPRQDRRLEVISGGAGALPTTPRATFTGARRRVL